MAESRPVAGPRTISLAYLTVRGTPPWEQVDCAKSCGFSHVGFRFHPVLDGEALLPVVGHPERLAQTEKRLRDTGVQLLDVEFFWIRPDTKVRDFEPYMEAGARMGARNLLVGASDPDQNRFIDHWLELCDLSAAHQLRPNLEFMPFPGLASINSYADAINLMKAAPHPNAGITIDAIHFFRSGSRLAEIVPAHYAYMSFMQLNDAAAGPVSLEEMQRQARADRLPPGRGGLDLAGLLNALPPTLPISIETPIAATEKWSAAERAKLVYDATQELLARL